MFARTGLKKGFVIEQALLHHLQALSELPEDVLIPPRLVVTGKTGERILEQLESVQEPNEAMQELFSLDTEPRPTEPR